MSNATASHPTADVLTAFGLGKLTEAETEVVARHLTACEACRRLVEGVPADSLVGLVRSAKQATVLPGAGPVALPATAEFNQTADQGEPLAPRDLPPELANHPKYQIRRVLGRGGMGVVYEAEHRHMGRKVALKVISQSLVDRPEAVERFTREVRAAAKLSHPNIVTAHDAEQAGSLHLLVMEYVEGQSLAQVVDKKGPLPVAHACHFVRQAALGLQHASEQGMVHRDLKPHNLMVTPKGQVKILDFGLARLAAEKSVGAGLTAEDAVMGTPEYLAPEQALDARQADVRADIYSLGCTLYCLLAGQPPFPEGTAMQKIMAHLEKQPRPLPEVRADVPAALWAVVERMLAKDLNQRYQQPVEVAQALVAFVKPGAKPTTPGGAPLPGMSSPKTGTLMGGDTSKVLKRQQGGTEKSPGPKAPAKDERPAPFENLRDTSSAVKKPKKTRAAAKPAPVAWYRRPPVLAGAVAAVLALGLGAWLLAGSIFKVKTPDGTIVLENLPPDAEVTVDGKIVTVKLGDGKTGEIRVSIDKKHRLEVTKGGVTVYSKEVEVDSHSGKPLILRIEPPKPPPATEPARLNAPFTEDEARQAQAAWAKHLGRKVIEVVDLGGGVTLELVLIPPGTFAMGSPKDEKGRNPLDKGFDAEQQHTVTITKPFYLAKYMATQEQYEKLVGNNPSYFRKEGDGKERVKGLPDTKQLPVDWVSWDEAGAFCKAVGEKTGWGKGCLPTEAQWEYACRAGTATAYSCGADTTNLDEYAWYGGDYSKGRPHAVGGKKPNAFGLHDMHGNAFQWCADYYGPYDGLGNEDPQRVDKSSLDLRVLRGGFWADRPEHCRAAYRYRGAPGGRYSGIGLRVCIRLETDGTKPDAQRRAAEWVLSLGGTVRVRVKGEEKEIDATGRLPAESFELLEIDLRKSKSEPVGDDGLAQLEGLTKLRTLFLWGQGISDAGLVHLKDLTNLRVLGLFSNPKVTDAGLAQLVRLTNLTNLDLNGTTVTDAGMVHLKGLTNLTELNLMGLRVTGTGLAHLKALTNLRVVLFSGGTVGDAELAQLVGLNNLALLGLEKTRVSDAGLVHLKDLPNLTTLVLAGLNISDAGLLQLHGLKGLRELDLTKTKVTSEGIAALKKALPECRIHANPTGGAPPADGFVSLFDGTELSFLSNWKTHPKQPGGWTVEDGCIVGRSATANHLFSERGDYENFHLRAEVQINKYGNSGIYFRSNFGVDRGDKFPNAYEAQICHSYPKTNVSLTGGLHGFSNVVKPMYKPDEWFTMDVIAQGNHIVIKINGEVTTDFTDKENTYRKGHFALQTMSDTVTNVTTVVRFRKVEVKELPPPTPDDQGFVRLFNGKDLDGWLIDGGDGKQWSVDAGTIVGRSANSGTRSYVLTKKEYADFVLRFDYKVEAGHHGVAIRATEGEKLPLGEKLIFDHPIVKLTNPEMDADWPTGTTNWLKSAEAQVQPVEVLPLPAGIWRTMEIVVRGDNCKATIDGKPVVNVTLDPDPRKSGAIVPGLKRVKGKVGFQTNTGAVRFRNIEIKELAATQLDRAGFVPLFNGKDLTGWKLPTGGTGDWKVVDGSIVSSGLASHLFSEGSNYENFHLYVEAMINDGGNSGVYFRTALGPGFPKGCEAQINSTHADPIRTGSLYPDNRVTKWSEGERKRMVVLEQLHRPGEWFTHEVIADGNHIIIKVNGKTTVDFVDEHNTYTKGRFALQQHDPGTVVKFRKIELKELPPVKPDRQGFVPLFNGKDLTGWQGLPHYWSVKDGAIVGSTYPAGITYNTFLCSKNKYKDFELQFQVKLTGKGWSGNSGVQIRSETFKPEQFAVKGPQADMGEAGNLNCWGSLYGEALPGVGMMREAPQDVVKKALKKNDFNDYSIKCVGKHVTIKLNGATTVDEAFPNLPDEGTIAWQLHSGPPMEVIFKNVQFKDLSSLGAAADGK
jgi:serine/threonine protein kinase/formylglycine-generating enzyme required for sulfatase activity